MLQRRKWFAIKIDSAVRDKLESRDRPQVIAEIIENAGAKRLI